MKPTETAKVSRVELMSRLALKNQLRLTASLVDRPYFAGG